MSARRIPALDGLRAISIVGVLIAHLSHRIPALETLQRFTGPLGELGVRVFFVISGFLITSLLLDEKARTGAIGLREFYVRRAIRILPALFVFLGLMVVAARLGWLPFPMRDLVHALTFTMNYDPARQWTAGHIWSLSVEEQFYLLWPAMMAILGARRSMRAAFVFIVLCPLLRVVLFRFVPSYRESVGESFETVADAIATGCVLAGAREWLSSHAFYRRARESRAVALLPLLILAVNAQSKHAMFTFAIGTTVINLGIALIVDRVTRAPPGLLDSAPARFVGVRSYSLYLWQQPFINPFVDAWSTRFPVSLAFAVVAAILSYALVEKPVLRLRSRFAR